MKKKSTVQKVNIIAKKLMENFPGLTLVQAIDIAAQIIQALEVDE